MGRTIRHRSTNRSRPSSEAAGRFPTTLAVSRRKSSDSATLQLAIGQSTLLVSPLQVARMMAAIANGGFLVKPQFASVAASSENANDILLTSDETKEFSDPQRIPDLSPRTLAIVKEGLRMVVNDPRGTGKSVRVRGLTVAGKTGTAETGGRQPDHAWFAGYVPADQPRIAFVVMLEHAGSGGKTAGPVAKKFIEALREAGLLRSETPN